MSTAIMNRPLTDATLDLAFDAVVAGFDAIWGRHDCFAAFGAIMRANPELTLGGARLAMERIAEKALADDSTLADAVPAS